MFLIRIRTGFHGLLDPDPGIKKTLKKCEKHHKSITGTVSHLKDIGTYIFKMVPAKCQVSFKTCQEKVNNQIFQTTQQGLWIRIRMDPHSFSLLDPDPGSKKFRNNRKIKGNW